MHTFNPRVDRYGEITWRNESDVFGDVARLTYQIEKYDQINLARDPELSYTPNTQTAVCHFTLAVARPRRNGEDQGADFLRVTVFGRQAENCGRYLAKGRQAAVHGRIETGSYKNKEGVTVNTVDIIADNVEFLGGGKSGSFR